jgi:hypothetical protein
MFSCDALGGSDEARRLAGTKAEGVNAVAEASVNATTLATNFMVKEWTGVWEAKTPRRGEFVRECLATTSGAIDDEKSCRR